MEKDGNSKGRGKFYKFYMIAGDFAGDLQGICTREWQSENHHRYKTLRQILSVVQTFQRPAVREGIPQDSFVEMALDKKTDREYRNPDVLYDYVIHRTENQNRKFCVFIDKIQMSYKIKDNDVDENLVAPKDRDALYTTFYDVLNDLMSRENLDVYVTGSNSEFLSQDVAANFRNRGTVIKVCPLSFAEYLPVSGTERTVALEKYLLYGGMPSAVLEENETEKRAYLQQLIKDVCISRTL